MADQYCYIKNVLVRTYVFYIELDYCLLNKTLILKSWSYCEMFVFLGLAVVLCFYNKVSFLINTDAMS